MMNNILVLGHVTLLPVIELFGTYLAQSTLLIGVVWLTIQFVRRIGQRAWSMRVGPAMEERLWKIAVVLGLITAPISVFSGWSHPYWEWSMRGEIRRVDPIASGRPDSGVISRPNRHVGAVAVSTTVTADIEPEHAFVTNSPQSATLATGSDAGDSEHLLPSSGGHSVDDKRSTTNVAPIQEQSSPPTQDTIDSPIVSSEHDRSFDLMTTDHVAAIVGPTNVFWFTMGFMTWIVAGFVRLAWNGRAMNRLLAQCLPIEGELRRELDRLAPRTRSIRLLRSQSTEGEPFACGLWHEAIVLPMGIEQHLTQDEVRALLAHEVAHLARRDPLWSWIGEIACTCFAFQPLNFVARQRWQQAAELLCDDWAVQQNVPATSLANCLAIIAERRLERRTSTLSLPGIGHSGLLTQRIEWLLRNNRASEPKQSRGRTFATFLAFAAGLFVGLSGPRLTFLMPVEAADNSSIAKLRQEIDLDLASTLDELERIESLLLDDSDPQIAHLAKQLHQRATSLKNSRFHYRHH